MNKVKNYLVYIGLGAVALGIFINFIMVKSNNDKKVNDSLKKARASKEAKRQANLKKQKEEQKELDKEAEEIIISLTVIENKN